MITRRHYANFSVAHGSNNRTTFTAARTWAAYAEVKIATVLNLFNSPHFRGHKHMRLYNYPSATGSNERQAVPGKFFGLASILPRKNATLKWACILSLSNVF